MRTVLERAWGRGGPALGGLGALVGVALAVEALSSGGGFAIISLRRPDAVSTCHWMGAAQVVNAATLGPATSASVVPAASAIGDTAHGLLGDPAVSLIALAPLASHGHRRDRRIGPRAPLARSRPRGERSPGRPPVADLGAAVSRASS